MRTWGAGPSSSLLAKRQAAQRPSPRPSLLAKRQAAQRPIAEALEALGEAHQPVLARALRRAGEVRRPVGRALEVLDGLQRRDLAEPAQLVGAVEQRAATGGASASPASRAASRTPSSVPCVAQQVAGGLLADALRAGQAVGRVAAQRDEVGHLLGLDAVAARAPRRARSARGRPCRPPRGKSTVTWSVTHWNMSRSPVKSSASPPASRLARGERAEEVVGLERRRGRGPSSRSPRRAAARRAHCVASPSGTRRRSAW